MSQYEMSSSSFNKYFIIIGLTASSLILCVSVVIFKVLRPLKSIRTTIHSHIFLAILLKNLTQMIILFQQMEYQLKQTDNNMPALCDTLKFTGEYATSTVFSWMLVEGQHLLHSANRSIKPFPIKIYKITAWIAPLAFNVMWLADLFFTIRQEEINICWFEYNSKINYFILQGPRIAALLYNGIILIRLIKRVTRTINERQNITPYYMVKMRKNVKAALGLLLLLGISNIRTFDIDMKSTNLLMIIWSFIKQFLDFFQGLFISYIYCVGNEEVHSVILQRVRNINDDYYRDLALCNCAVTRRQLVETIDRPTCRLHPHFFPHGMRSASIPQAGDNIIEDMPLPDILIERLNMANQPSFSGSSRVPFEGPMEINV